MITGSVRDEGTTVQYVPIEYPAIADISVTNALLNSVNKLKYPFTSGIAQAKDSFYGQHDPESMPNSDYLNSRWKAWEKAGVMASEMETSTLFIVSQIRGAKAGAIMAYKEMNAHTIEVAIEAIREMINQGVV